MSRYIEFRITGLPIEYYETEDGHGNVVKEPGAFDVEVVTSSSVGLSLEDFRKLYREKRALRVDIPNEWLADRTCPDGGKCHHGCHHYGCKRVVQSGPLSGVYPNDEWPAWLRELMAEEAYVDSIREDRG